jgi:ribonuclease J
LPRGEICYIAGGTQGEERGALRRLASGMHQGLRLEPGDVVILSSRVIPGNERGVNGMVDALLALGVDVRTRHAEPELHVSGHGHRDEQRRMLALTRPRAFVPVHGTRIHMLRHEALARELGVAHTLLMQDGDVARLDADGLTKVGEARTGIVALAGTPSQPVALDDEVLRERRQLGRAGIAFVALDGDRVVVRVRGLPTADALVVEGERAARSALRALGAERGPQAQEMVRRAVRRRLTELLGDKPPVEVVAFD